MVLSKNKILEAIKNGEIGIDPFSEEYLGEISYDLHISVSEELVVPSQGFVTIKTKENLILSPGIACLVTTRGGAARKGIDAVQSSLVCDPSTNNPITLEVSNATNEPIQLFDGMSIAKATFVKVLL